MENIALRPYAVAVLAGLEELHQKYLAGPCNDDERQNRAVKLGRAIIYEMERPEHRLNYADDYTALFSSLSRLIDKAAPE